MKAFLENGADPHATIAGAKVESIVAQVLDMASRTLCEDDAQNLKVVYRQAIDASREKRAKSVPTLKLSRVPKGGTTAKPETKQSRLRLPWRN
jgi:hypothetical protein